MDFKVAENEQLLRSKFVFPLDDPPTDVFGKHLKDFEATGHSFECCEIDMPCLCSTVDVSVKYSFFTEGILERKRQEISECFGCSEKDLNTWRWYPRHEIDQIKVDTDAHSRCCGLCHFGPCAGWCAKSHTIVDVVTRYEASTGVNDAQWGGSMKKNKKVSLKLTPDEAEIFYVYCQNYTYNTNYHAARVYNMEFLKGVCSDKYQVTPTDWVNYYLSSNGEHNRPPVPQIHGARYGDGGSGGGGGGRQPNPCDNFCGPCAGVCLVGCGACTNCMNRMQ
jgi:hypothetical protein